MSRLPSISFASLLLLSVACSSGTDGAPAEADGGSRNATGGAPASAGSTELPAAGAGGAAHGGMTGHFGNGGSASDGVAGAFIAAGGLAGGSGARALGGGGASPSGGAGPKAGGGAPSGGGSGGTSGASAGAGAGGMVCPGAGHITYTITKSASPTATEQAAYDKIKLGMDKAISYYDCYTNISKSLKVSYVPSVETADGNINGSIRFGMNTTYMDYRSAMHEIAHTLGIGQASNWGTFLAGGLFTGTHAAAQLKAINAKLAVPLYTELHADTQHFWPYGINQQSEVKSEADLIAHCQMVLAIRQDLGL